MFNGKTRYRGRALEKMFDLTAGSPFYLQITCDRLVQHLNDRRAVFITEADIDYVAHILTVGTETLPPERFNALVTAAGKKVDTISEDDLWHLLRRLARASSQNGWCYRNILAEISNSDKALKDLVDREIIVPKGDRVSIRVGLFAKWLRTN
ncbi:MAG: hypothetical protein AYP45_08640 [Candidatus Brocadia carolinensis]|uniref:Uncharacterized protein n=1 Tax=Candidatus Brocadia carolinensis TaxID=1004156 RepID=A0A1V4ATW8_9BACT|nr:MAG: hypothetical protein AYP45_08640 [Candidatus Brocadia caroliniensis]